MMRSIKQWCDYIVKWREKKGFKTCWGNVPEKLMLTVGELSEAMEAYRKIPSIILCILGSSIAINKHYRKRILEHKEALDNLAEELADATIRICDLCASLNIDLEKEMSKKMKINEKRPIMHGKNC